MQRDKRLFQKIIRRVNNAIKDFAMFSRNDRVLLAVSGGKDSLVLALVLRHLNYNFEVLHIDLHIQGYSREACDKVSNFCEFHEIPFTIISSFDAVGLEVGKLNTANKTCAVCGSIKRQIFNSFASEKGLNVIAVAHNLDDEAAMLFANNRLWHFDYLKKSLPVLQAKQGFVKRVKPLCYVRESELKEFSEQAGIDVVKTTCPFSRYGSRLKYNHILAHAENEFSGFAYDYYLSFIRQFRLVESIEAEQLELQPCKECGELTTSGYCRLCRVKKGEWDN